MVDDDFSFANPLIVFVTTHASLTESSQVFDETSCWSLDHRHHSFGTSAKFTCYHGFRNNSFSENVMYALNGRCHR